MDFAAIGLDGPGDAFVAADDGPDGRVVMVDCGTSGGGASAWLTDHGINTIDVLVLTHSDADHIGGAPAVLGAVNRAVDELWIPSSWIDALHSVAHDGFVVRVRDVDDVDIGPRDVLEDGEGGQSARLERWASRVLRRRELTESRSPTDGVLETHPVGRDSLRRLTEQRVEVVAAGGGGIADELANHVEAIQDVLRAADQAGARVRLFSYQDACRGGNREVWRTSGEPGLLTIVNGVEVRTSTATESGLSIALTIVNAQALVPFLWNDDDRGGAAGRGVLITADSGFAFDDVVDVPWAGAGIVTAPHHGSNDAAHHRVYDGAAKAGFSGWWVRSDNGHKARPGQRWRDLPLARRTCTRCRGMGPGERRDVRFVSDPYSFEADAARWKRRAARPCVC